MADINIFENLSSGSEKVVKTSKTSGSWDVEKIIRNAKKVNKLRESKSEHYSDDASEIKWASII